MEEPVVFDFTLQVLRNVASSLWPYTVSQEANVEHVFFQVPFHDGGIQWRNWLRHCATSRKVTGSIPDGVIGIFH